MRLYKLQVAMTACVLVGAVSIAPGLPIPSLAHCDEPKASTASAQPKDRMQLPPQAACSCSGRVLEPQGKAVPRATVVLHARKLGLASPDQVRMSLIPIAEGQSDDSGNFRLDAPRTASSAYYADLGAMALAPGYGAGWADLNVDDDEPTAVINCDPSK